MHPKIIVSTANNMTVYYHTGANDYKMRGFRLSMRQGCQGTILDDAGEVISPGYNADLNYPDYQHCMFTVRARETVPLKFMIHEDFALSGTLGEDTLTVRTYVCSWMVLDIVVVVVVVVVFTLWSILMCVCVCVSVRV